jgi:hypothetical protein
MPVLQPGRRFQAVFNKATSLVYQGHSVLPTQEAVSFFQLISGNARF